jgi:hypothetical protein
MEFNHIKSIRYNIKLYKGDIYMPDYEAMYGILFRKVTSVIEELQDIQRQVEEMYISSNSPRSDGLRVIEGQDGLVKEKKRRCASR